MMCGARRSPKEKRTPSYEYSTPSYWPVLRSRDCHVCMPLYYISFLSCLPSSLTWTIGRAGASEGNVYVHIVLNEAQERRSVPIIVHVHRQGIPIFSCFPLFLHSVSHEQGGKTSYLLASFMCLAQSRP